MGEVRSGWDSNEEIGLLRHVVPRGGGRSFGIRNETRGTGRLFWLQSLRGDAPPSKMNHESEATGIYDHFNDQCLVKPCVGKLGLLTECWNNPRCDQDVCVDEFTNSLFVPVRW